MYVFFKKKVVCVRRFPFCFRNIFREMLARKVTLVGGTVVLALTVLLLFFEHGSQFMDVLPVTRQTQKQFETVFEKESVDGSRYEPLEVPEMKQPHSILPKMDEDNRITESNKLPEINQTRQSPAPVLNKENNNKPITVPEMKPTHSNLSKLDKGNSFESINLPEVKQTTLIFPKLEKENRYTPDWESLDSRPLPSWYDDAKFGIFIHWGVYSVPSFGSEWFWTYWKNSKKRKYVEFMEKNYRPGFSYAEFGPMFTAEFFDPDQWADIFNSSGAKYVVLTSKHHEGFTLWPSKYSWNWNAMDVGPKRDLVGDLATAIRKKPQLKFGLYHSLLEWFNPLYLQDKANEWKTQDFVTSKIMPELFEIVNKYEPSIVWSDGDWEATDTYWNSTNFLAWLFNDSPVKNEVVTNDRWGIGAMCHHGDIYTCSDRFNPGTLQLHKWENCFTIDSDSWGFRRDAVLSDYYTTEELLQEMVKTVSCGGNMLLNVGPTSYGQIPPIYEERLRQIGYWLHINGEAIYGSRPWIFQNDTRTPDIWYTKGTSSKEGLSNPVYAIVLVWPESGTIELFAPVARAETEVKFLGYSETIKWTILPSGIRVNFPCKSKVSNDWAWVLRLDNLVY